jgi:hypothetical protein
VKLNTSDFNIYQFCINTAGYYSKYVYTSHENDIKERRICQTNYKIIDLETATENN